MPDDETMFVEFGDGSCNTADDELYLDAVGSAFVGEVTWFVGAMFMEGGANA